MGNNESIDGEQIPPEHGTDDQKQPDAADDPPKIIERSHRRKWTRDVGWLNTRCHSNRVCIVLDDGRLLSGDNTRREAGYHPNAIAIWNMDTEALELIQTPNKCEIVDSACQLSSGSQIVVSTGELSLVIVDILSGVHARICGSTYHRSVHACRDGDRFIASGVYAAYLWNGSTSLLLRSFDHEQYVQHAIELQGNQIATTIYQHESIGIYRTPVFTDIELWDIESGAHTATLGNAQAGSITQLGCGLLAAGTTENAITLWDLRIDKCVKRMTTNHDQVRDIHELQDGRLMAIGDGRIVGASALIWDWESGCCDSIIGPANDKILVGCQLHDGRLILSQNNNALSIWE